MLINGEPLFMVGIDSGFGWCSFGGRGGGGGRGFRDRPINIAPKFLAMKVRFELTKPS